MPNDDSKPETTETTPAEEARPEARTDSRPDLEAGEKGPVPEMVDAPASELSASEPETTIHALPPEAVDSATGWGKWGPLAVATALPLAFFFLVPPLTRSGLWDPYELNVADLSRRLGLTLLGASKLALDGADNSMPHLNDLGRPELSFDSIALGFKLFGLHEWAGRTPLALWGLAGVLATYAFVSRLVDKRAGMFAAAVLTTTPLYFVQARTMLGDVVSMASLAMAFGGLAVAVFDRDEKGPTPFAARLPWLTMGLLGLFTGYMSRGGALGIAAPTLAVAAAWSVSRASSDDRNDDRVGMLVALAAGALGLFATVRALQVFGEDKVNDLSPWIGAMLKPQGKYPTYDYYIGHLAHSCAPWSAFVPFAFARLFLAPAGRTGSLARRETDARVALVVGSTFLLVVHGWLAARTDLIPFEGVAILAAACGIALRDYERGALPSGAVGVGTLVLLALCHHDFHELPDKAYQAFGVTGPAFPESFKAHALLLWTVVLIGFAGLGLILWFERDSKRRPFDPAEYLKILRAFRDAWDGLLALGFFALVAGFSLGALAIWIGMRTHGAWMPTLSLQVRDVLLNAWWFVAFVPLAAIFALYFAFDVMLWTFERAQPWSSASFTRGFEPFEKLYGQLRGEAVEKPATTPTLGDAADYRTAAPATGDTVESTARDERLMALFVLVPLMVLALPAVVMALLINQGTKPLVAASIAIPSGVALFLALGVIGAFLRGLRATFIPMVGVLVGFILCYSYYPALANQLSPKEVFESFQKVHKGDEPLALFGVGGRTAAYYAGGQPTQLHDATGAFQWLTGGEPGARRYLAMKSDELPKLNQMYREHSEPRANLPVLDARSSQILLVASKLESGEKNESPIEKFVLDAEPHPQHKLDVNMEDKLQVLGFDTADEQGHLVNSVVPGRAYRMRTYYRVLAPVTTEWEAFIHIDGYRRRHNGDHKPMDGKYPFALWLPGDLIVDDYEFKLEPNFSPGNYTVYFGLFVGDTRMKVKSGPNDGDNRINGGPLRVQ